ncbi:hypothetical protein V6Z12_D02G180700 [Gossypium hirsutum]
MMPPYLGCFIFILRSKLLRIKGMGQISKWPVL